MVASTTKPSLNFYDHPGTQNLFDSLVTEAIQIWGLDMSYLPRRRDTFDPIFYEDDTSFFDTAYGIPIYVKTAEGFMGQEAFMSSFGLEIRPQIVLTVSRFQFENNILSEEPELLRPREADLIYFPMNNRVFEIKFVDDKPFFYQGGALQVYDLTCELYEYSGERFSTGILEIDSIEIKLSTDILRLALHDRAQDTILDRAGRIIVPRGWGDNEDIYDALQINDEIADVSNASSNNTTSLIDWSEDNPFGEGIF